MKILNVLFLAVVAFALCCCGDSGSTNQDSGADTDTDTDSDSDSDTDADTDSDTDSDSDSDTDSDTDTDIDAGPDSGPDSGPTTLYNMMFVTSIDVTPGSLGGLAGADAVCQARATAGGLPSNTYIAWLSTTTVNAIDRLTSAGARGWIRPDGLPFADEPSDIVGSQIFYPPMIDELGNRVPENTQVVTGTTSQGQVYTTGTCVDYTDTTSNLTRSGIADSGSIVWTHYGTVDCDASARLYCFGTNYDEEVAPAPHTGRRAFVTNSQVAPGFAISGADSACATAASSAGLTGTFIALIATDSASAASRFNTTGGNWARVDDVLLAASPSDLLTGQPRMASLNLIASGTSYLGNSAVWTGATEIDQVGNSTCTNWTSTSSSDTGTAGIIAFSSSDGFSNMPFACSSTFLNVYCLEQ